MQPGPVAALAVTSESADEVVPTEACVDGNEAAARVAYAFSEVIPIYPITPASPMAELADEWAAAARPNLWGAVPEIVEMQSEAGAAGTLHGALQRGAFATTFTASQGLLLMVPNMFKIAGELTPCAMHVAARTIATHALSIFGDHSDVMHARTTGWAMLAAGSVQEAHDFAAVAHAATLRSARAVPALLRRLPHVARGRQDRPARRRRPAGAGRRRRRARPPRAGPHARRAGAARLGPEPRRVLPGPRGGQPVLRRRARHRRGGVRRAGRPLRPPLRAGRLRRRRRRRSCRRADGLGRGRRRGGRRGADRRRRAGRAAEGAALYRPFPAAHLVRALPPTVRSIAVLDRTKEPGATGEPLLLDVIATLHDAMDTDDAAVRASSPRDRRALRPVLEGVPPRPCQGRSSTSWPGSTTPEAPRPPKRRFTVGIHDDVTRLSLDVDDDFRYPRPAGEVQAMFFGLGADGTVGANKASVKIIGEHTDLFAQGYFVYDSKKSGSVTVSHLRFGPEPIRSTYLIEDADFVACHQFGLLEKMPVLDRAKPGATFLLNSPYRRDEVWDRLPEEVQRQIIDKDLDVWAIDANRVATDSELGARINTVMQPCFFALAGVLPGGRGDRPHQGVGRRAPTGSGAAIVVERNVAAIDASLAALARVEVPADGDVAAQPAQTCPARRRSRLRHPGHGPADGRRRRPAAGVGPPRRRHVPDRHRPVREAGHRPGDPDLGPRHLHRLRQVRHRLPARHDPDEGLRAVGARRRTAGRSSRRTSARRTSPATA